MNKLHGMIGDYTPGAGLQTLVSIKSHRSCRTATTWGLFTQMPKGTGWDNLSVIDMNTKYWSEINKLHIDNIIANGGDIRFIHDPNIDKNIWNYVADMPDNDFKVKCVSEGLVKIKTFTKMEYDYLVSKGYVLHTNGLMKKP